MKKPKMASQHVVIPSDSVQLEGDLAIPEHAPGIVVFAHGSGSSRLSPRNQFVAEALREAGLGTLLFDLLTEDEAVDRQNVFDIGFLAHRLRDATEWLRAHSSAEGRPLAYFGASTGAAAALTAATLSPPISSIVSRGGRPDLAMPCLADVEAPTLLIVGGLDTAVIELNEQAYRILRCEKSLKIVSGATHLFEEPGTLEQAARMASEWFVSHFAQAYDSERSPTYPQVFADRREAGRLLARALAAYKGGDVVVIGVPRGGLPVAREVANSLRAPLDIIVVRKLGAPDQPDLAIGAVVDSDQPRTIFNREVIDELGVSASYIQHEIERQLIEIRRREAAYRAGREPIQLAGKTVILIDDGIATGSSIRAALRGLRGAQPKRLVLAVPVAPSETIDALRGDADEIVCLETPPGFYAVGQFYRDFDQVSDGEVTAILKAARASEARDSA